MFVEAAIQSLYNAGTLKTTTTVYPSLPGFSKPVDSRSDTITVQQLLDHKGGYNDDPVSKGGSGFDPTYSMRTIATSMNLNHPCTKLDIARYMYGRPLDSNPGAEYHYSNYGYLLLTALIEHVTGMDYFQYLQKKILAPLGITEVAVCSTNAQQRPPNVAICEDEGMGLDPVNLTSQIPIPSVYGGDGQIKEVAVGCADLAVSANALTQFIHVNLVWGNGPRPQNNSNWLWARTGSTFGSSTEATSFSTGNGNGIDWAYCINTRDWPAQTTMTLDNLGTNISQLITSLNLTA